MNSENATSKAVEFLRGCHEDFADDRSAQGVIHSFMAVAIAQKYQRLEKAATALLPYLECSTDGPHAVNAMYISPSEGLRRAAREMEEKDAAIREFRKALAFDPLLPS